MLAVANPFVGFSVAAGGFTLVGGAATVGTAWRLLLERWVLAFTFFGIAQAISPQPDVPDFDESAQLESFSFSNVVNTSRQGLPVPIAYGRVFAGSAIISSGTDVDEVRA